MRVSPRTMKVGALMIVIALGVIGWRLGVVEQFGSPARLKQTLLELGPWGYVAFVVAYATLQPFGVVPGTVFVMVAPLIWPWPIAFALSMTGTMAASIDGFWFARFMARDWVAAKIPARFRKYEDALERRAFTTVFVLRFIFWMPPMLHSFFGVSNVRFWTHFWGSLAGYVVPLFIVSFFGERLVAALRGVPAETWIALGAGALTIACGVWLLLRRTRKARA